MNNAKQMALPVLITATILLPIGFIVGRLTSGETEIESTSTTAEMKKTEDRADHSHESMESKSESKPTISKLKVAKDPKSGWNLTFETTNFTFAPNSASSEHVEGEGHAHLFIDGKKITRLYSNAFYIEHLDEGSHEVKVVLNSNNHKEITVDGQIVGASIKVTDMHHSQGDEAAHGEHEMAH